MGPELGASGPDGGGHKVLCPQNYGGNIIEERNTGGVLRRYVYGPGYDAPIVWYEGSGTADKRYMIADERGSITAVTGATGTVLGINRYDEYGIPASTNIGRFGYTGQAWIPELGMNYYKARIYSPTLGRFMQTDPIGYGDGMNMYNYVGSDPVNGVDPMGLAKVCVLPTGPGDSKKECEAAGGEWVDEIVVTGNQDSGSAWVLSGFGSGSIFSGGSGGTIVVTAAKNKKSKKSAPKNDEGQKDRMDELRDRARDKDCFGTRACLQEQITHDEKCKAIADISRGATYAGGASWAITLRWPNPWTAAASGGITVVGVLNQLNSDLEGC